MSESEHVTDGKQVELRGNVLDLSQPELAPMERYRSQGNLSGYQVFRQPSAVVVTRFDGEEKTIAEALEHEGWFVKTCAGPGRGACPIMRGERCSLRQSVDAAVVFIDPRERDRQVGVLPRIRCAADSASPGVVALEGRLDTPHYVDETATVGAVRGPDAIIAAITTLIGARSD